MKKIAIILSSLFGFIASNSAAESEHLLINEIMQSDIGCVVDDVNQFPDSWVELYNPTDKRISLSGYKLGDKEKPSKAYTLVGSYYVEPHSHFLIYCDKEGFNRHADFRLESTSKGSLYLFYNDEIVDNLDYKKMPAPNVSYGRETDGSDTWGYQVKPSPQAPNGGGISDVILGEPRFSVTGRVCNAPFGLSLSLPDDAPEGTVIRYTIDGSEPTAESAIYGSSIKISFNTVVRAKLFCEGAVSLPSTTHSYIFHPQSITLPIISIVTDRKYLYSDEMGIMSDAKVYNPELENFWYDWRRPANFEFFTEDDSDAELNQIIETKLKGAATRTYAIKSMVFYANKRFGTKRFSYEFFPDQKPGLTEFKSIEARNAGNDCYRAYIRDALFQRMMGENANVDWQAWRPAVVYLNGVYHGILNIRERSNDDNIYTNYDGLEDIDMIENWNIVEAGDIDSFNEFKDFYSRNDISYEEFAQWMDIDEFINYFIMEMYYANYDFLGNNLMMWRPKEEGGKWRWLAKDLDYGLGCAYADGGTMDFLDWLYNPEHFIPSVNFGVTEESSMLFRKLLANPEVSAQFVKTFAVYMGDFLTDQKTIEKINEMRSILEPEWQRHYDKNNVEKWDNKRMVQLLIDCAIERHQVVYDQLANWYKLGTPVPLTITDGQGLADRLIVQNIALINSEFDGKYFAGEKVSVAVPEDNDGNIGGWLLTTIDSKGIKNETFIEGKNIDFIMPAEAKSVNVSPVEGKNGENGIDGIPAEDFNSAETLIFNLNGMPVDRNNLSKGVYIYKTPTGASGKIMIK